MTPEQQANKLRLIAGLCLGQCEGWPDGWKADKRDPFPGEVAALRQRERELGR